MFRLVLPIYFHATHFVKSECKWRKGYEVYTQSGLSWSMVFVRIGAASYEQLVQLRV